MQKFAQNLTDGPIYVLIAKADIKIVLLKKIFVMKILLKKIVDKLINSRKGINLDSN